MLADQAREAARNRSNEQFKEGFSHGKYEISKKIMEVCEDKSYAFSTSKVSWARGIAAWAVSEGFEVEVDDESYPKQVIVTIYW